MNTNPSSTGTRLRWAVVLAVLGCLWHHWAQNAAAAQVWNGPTIGFTNLLGSDPTLPASQDRITPNVWLTRGATRGIYNIKVENGYTHNLSPVGTEWAYGQLTNYSSLFYQNWEGWNVHHPPDMVGQDAVLHIIPDDTYLAIKFTSWGIGSGGFSYLRSTQSVPEPASGALVLTGLGLAAGNLVYRRKR
jgi:hypothetical protein